MHFIRSSSVCVLLPIDFFARIKLDINSIASYRIASKNIYIYIIKTQYTPQP